MMTIPTAGLLLFLAAPEGGHWARDWASIKATAGKVAAVEASFVQRKRMPLLTKPLISRGQLTFRAPGYLRWEYRSPVRSLLEMKNGRVRRYLWEDGRLRPDSRQSPDAMQVVLTEITAWLAGRFQSSQNFKAALVPGTPPRIRLTPRKKALGRFIQHILLHPSKKPGAIDKVVIQEPGDASTTLEFVRCKVTYR